MRSVPQNQAKDTGLALVLVLLIIGHFWDKSALMLPAIGILLLSMTFPLIFSPLAWLWFGLSRILADIVSRALLTLLFLVVVIPVALIRRLFGADPMRLKAWKNREDSVLKERDHTFSAEDLERPY
jgi:hypothetical protein